MTRSVLCGVDGSSDARVALRAAARLAVQLDVRLVVAHVVQASIATTPLLGPAGGAAFTSGAGGELAAGRLLLESVLSEEGLAGAAQRVVLGFPADRLADLADDEAAELIVVGSRGRGVFRSAFLGSVSTDLIGVARCPVLVVPHGAHP